MSDKKRVIALGFFDGVHLGHGQLLNKVNQRASEIDAMPSVLSFDVHPDTLVFGREGYGNVEWMLLNLCSGGLMLGAIFMATDYSTSPVTPNGQLIFGVGCGLLTVLIRYFGGYPEGVSYAILIMNLLVWAIDKATPQTQFGISKADKKVAEAERKAAKAAEKADKLQKQVEKLHAEGGHK